MKTRKNLKLLAFATAISLVLSSFLTVNVIADDSVPPAESGTTQQSTEEPATEDTSVPEGSVATEEPTAEETSVPDIPVMAGESTVEATPQTLPEVLEKLPQETEVVVLVDAQIEPLATQAAANTFIAGDPIWCEDGVAPAAGAAGCTDSYTSLLLLLNDIESGSALNFSPVNGTIWIQGNDTSSGAIDIDSLTFTGWSSASLTLQGGWDGTSNLGSNILASPSVFFQPISITDWSANISINNITISNTSATGLDIQTSGSVSLIDVIANGNAGSGITIDADGGIEFENVTASYNNLSGASLTTLGDVDFMGGNFFQNNDETGLVIEAEGDITLENVNASENGAGGVSGGGADLISNSGSVTLTGSNTFDGNLETGLTVGSALDIDAENVQASGNGANGADLTSGGDTIISGDNYFDGNAGGSGLIVDSGGDLDIQANNFSADNNSVNGVDLTTVNSVSLLGMLTSFNGNGLNGLLVDAGADVDLENIYADSNVVGANITLLGSLSMTGINAFTKNDGVGIFADAGMDIDIENLTANENGLVTGIDYGAEFYSGNGFYLSGSNLFIGNGSSGLYVEAIGEVDAENIRADGNGGAGAEFTTLADFSLSGVNFFVDNTLDGLIVNANGIISIEEVTALLNGGNGIFIEGNSTAVITCGETLGNGFYEIETDLNGFLTLAGVNFGDNLDRLGVDEDYLVLVSNGCHTYPRSLFTSEDDDDEDSNMGSTNPQPASIPPLPVNVVDAQNGELVRLQCTAYQGTLLRTQAGEAYIPCPIVDSARLLTIPPSALPGALPAGTSFLSSMHLAITRDGLSYSPPNVPGSIWYTDVSASDANFDKQVVYWNGSEWVDITGSLNSFIHLFFPATGDLAQKDLAILYWDGSGWVELSDGLYFENGGVVLAGGFLDNGFFQTMTNFIGTFVLVEK